ncbi:hypothetical protein PG984_003424 [Apiospora sp. TS-2023a]
MSPVMDFFLGVCQSLVANAIWAVLFKLGWGVFWFVVLLVVELPCVGIRWFLVWVASKIPVPACMRKFAASVSSVCKKFGKWLAKTGLGIKFKRAAGRIGAAVWAFRSSIIPVTLLISSADGLYSFALWADGKQDHANKKESEWKQWGTESAVAL